MCWSVPGKIIEIDKNSAVVDISGVKKSIRLDLISDASVGEYVLIHAGYAIGKVDEASANFTIDFFKGKVSDA